MRRLLTAGMFSTILTLIGTSDANASIISRGFFDEAMANYALKTDVGDISDLQSKIIDISWLDDELVKDFQNFALYGAVLEYVNNPSIASLFDAILTSGRDSLIYRLFKMIVYGGYMDNSGQIVDGMPVLMRRVSELSGKLGIIPAKYSNVGAALSAIDVQIDAKNLPDNTDDGQYVLTAVKDNGNVSYVWVKMDLTTEERIQ